MHRRPDLYTRWSLEVRSKQFFHPGQRVGVGVSGGPDSVLLLHFMTKLAGEEGLTVAAVHFNHRLRGAESDGDEAMVRDLPRHSKWIICGEKLKSHVWPANAMAIWKQWRGSCAIAISSRWLIRDRMDLVATAHTANDQAETVLMRLLRGTGTRGLGGIYPLLEGKVVRPFLGLTREEVVQGNCRA